ncbi:hypothetical protein IPZ60_04780 [Psychrobacter sp. NG25]|uniref:DUF6236 family protein n=1 Tax=Psychrobacter sp. NG25 TaxID=2782005 RepID=UPI00188460E6|nr:DUF6236 family protein [Psychrobacter sp. NG25]MBF0658053.1 hypothetical protein [Psychrobacter sp. NG25]
MKRGIIAAPGIINRLPRGFQMERSLNIDELRYYVLYWDEVVIPANNAVYIGIPQEEAFILAGAIKRPSVQLSGLIDTDAMLSCQSKVAEALVKENKGVDWVIQQFGEECLLLENYSEERNTLRIDLASCLPVPTGEVNVYDILDFKERRKNEFIALHEYLDEVYEQALLSPDQSLASKKAVYKLTKSIEDLDRVTLERFKLFKKHDLSAVFNLYRDKIVEGVIMDVVATAFTGSTVPVVTIGGIISATIKVSANSTQTFKPADENLKLAYLSIAQKDGLY